MPTKPDENFIPRNIDDSGIQEILNQYSQALEEVVNFASIVAIWSADKCHGGEELAPLFLSYRHVIELVDSISVLVKDSCIEPSKILLRSIFESILLMRYIFEKNSKIRGMDFMTCHWHEKIKFYRKYKPDDSMHKELIAKQKKDKILKDWPIISNPEAADAVEMIKNILTKPEFEESEKEYQRFKRTERKKPNGTPRRRLNWYSMHSGPANIQTLADYLGIPLQYDYLYRKWSGLAHGFDIIEDKVNIIDEDKVLSSQIRLPKDAFFVTQMTMSFGLEVIRHFIDNFAPEKTKKAKGWYAKEIVPLRKTVLRKERIIVK